jgi:hypothetical protein
LPDPHDLRAQRSNIAAMSIWAKPGVKCVCIDSKARKMKLPGLPPVEFGGVYPVEGQVYTVASVEWYESIYPEIVESFLGIHLVEIVRPPGMMTGDVVPYRIERFRPLVRRTKKQSLALFTPLLRGARMLEDA